MGIHVRKFLSNELSNIYTVIEAADGNEGFEKVLKHQLGLPITDLMMPEMTGTQLCQKLKRAAWLLQQGLPVSEVTDRVGFSTISYFGKYFLEEFGVKPSVFVSKT